MAEVVWSDSALKDIDEIAEFISRDSVYYAERLVSSFFEHSDILELFPKAGKKVPEREDIRYRELQVPPFRMIYKLEEDTPVMVAVIHSKRDSRKIIKKLK